jgi:hypothetical protein
VKLRPTWWISMSLASALTAASGTGTPPPAKPSPTPPNDESFIEFLGADDVEDAGWWEFLKAKQPQPDPAPSPSGTKP